MRITPISGDMAMKLALGLAAVLAVAYLTKRAGQAASGAFSAAYDSAAAAAQAVNPFNQDNAIYGAANRIGGAIVTSPDGPGKNADGSFTVGGWLYDVTHPADYNTIKNISKPVTNPPPEWDYSTGFSP